MKQLIFSICVGLLLITLSAHDCRADETQNISRINDIEPEIPIDIRKRLEKNIIELNPCSFVWKEQRSSNMDINVFCKRFNLGPGILNYFHPVHNVYLWQDNKAFLYTNRYVVSTGINSVKIDKTGKALTTPRNEDLQTRRAYSEVSMDGINYYSGEKEGDEQKPTGLSVHPITQIMETDKNYPLFFQIYL